MLNYTTKTAAVKAATNIMYHAKIRRKALYGTSEDMSQFKSKPLRLSENGSRTYASG